MNTLLRMRSGCAANKLQSLILFWDCRCPAVDSEKNLNHWVSRHVHSADMYSSIGSPMGTTVLVPTVLARECCRISPPGFLIECRKRRLNHGNSFLLYFALFSFWSVFICVFPVLFCLSVSVKWLAVKIASKITYVSGRALNSPPYPHQLFPFRVPSAWVSFWSDPCVICSYPTPSPSYPTRFCRLSLGAQFSIYAK